LAIPGSELAATSVPTRVAHGGADSTVPLPESDQVVDALRRPGVAVEALSLPVEGFALTLSTTADEGDLDGGVT
jgi:dipeptidyl aminopeptidase/acylaminoacyl peptidase